MSDVMLCVNLIYLVQRLAGWLVGWFGCLFVAHATAEEGAWLINQSIETGQGLIVRAMCAASDDNN